ncbi:MAG TPA: signal peptidase I [Acidimicrobiales bacterium]|nr:signal peptidase I [Acidimicrobiales bacterium]
MTDTTLTDPDDPTVAVPSKQHSLRRNLEWVVIVAVAILSALVVKTYLVEAFYIPSGSMEPTLKTGDRVLVNKLSYRLHDIHRGDVVVFKRPPGVAGEADIKDFIKRVIGLPGDTIETRGDAVYVNGKRLKESYLPRGTRTVPSIDIKKVPPHHLWVMGDNRTNSSDSRFFGPIEEDSVIGRAFVQVWPPTSVETL